MRRDWIIWKKFSSEEPPPTNVLLANAFYVIKLTIFAMFQSVAIKKPYIRAAEGVKSIVILSFDVYVIAPSVRNYTIQLYNFKEKL